MTENKEIIQGVEQINELEHKAEEVHAELVEETAVEPEENSCECKQEHEEPAKRKRKRCLDVLITKKEGLVMFVSTLTIIILCALLLQNAVLNVGSNLMDKTDDILLRVDDVDLYIDGLEAKIEMLENELANMNKKLDEYQASVIEKQFSVIINNSDASKKYTYDPLTGNVYIKGEQAVEFDNSPFFGVGFYGTEEEISGSMGLQVHVVYPGSPAELAGMKVGDILIEMDGVQMTAFADLESVITGHQVGEIVTVKYATVMDGMINIMTSDVALDARGNFDLGE